MTVSTPAAASTFQLERVVHRPGGHGQPGPVGLGHQRRVDQVHMGVEGRAPPLESQGQPCHRVEPRGQEQPGGEVGCDRADRLQGVRPERRDHHVGTPARRHHQLDHVPGHPVLGVEAGLAGQVLDLDVDGAARRRPRERRPGAGRTGGRSAVVSSATGPGPGDHRVVVDGQPAVGGQPDVQLDPVGAQLAGPGEGVEGVLDDPGGPDRGCPGGPRIAVEPMSADPPRPWPVRGRNPARIDVRRAPKLLATEGAGDYSSERTLNGR